MLGSFAPLAQLPKSSGAVFVVIALGSLGCEEHVVDVEVPPSGRTLTREERRELQRVADIAFHDVKNQLDGLPSRVTLIVRWGKDVIPETGENGAAAYPGNIGWTLDPDRDVRTTIRTQLRPTLVHELHHLARASRVATVSLSDHVVTEGLATAFERDFAKVDPPWGRPPSEAWVDEILSQPPDADVHAWMIRHADGRRWIGMRVGTMLVDRASRASGRSPASLVFTPTADILRFSHAR
jgi:hypothetical protein